MSAHDLTVLRSPEFPQALEDAVHFEIRRVDRILSQSYLTRCYFSDPDCPNCRATATVHDLKTGQEFCLDHFQAVRRG